LKTAGNKSSEINRKTPQSVNLDAGENLVSDSADPKGNLRGKFGERERQKYCIVSKQIRLTIKTKQLLDSNRLFVAKN